VQPGVYAALLNQNTVNKTLLHEGQEFDNRRTIRTYKNYRRVLVLTQPSANACVHVLDGRQPEYSRYENALVRLVGPFSNFENIVVNGSAPTMPVMIFGSEPEHTWCYFYQKAALARQSSNWDEVLALGEEVLSRKLQPGDLIEWMPFLEAFAQQGDIERLQELAPNVTTDSYVAQQACQILSGMQNITEETMEVIRLIYCIE
jgi:hypothetical protein